MNPRSIHSAIVTGPTGAVGTALCRRLVRAGVAVYAVMRPGSGRAAHLRDMRGVQTVECDLSALPALPGLLPEVRADAFFHLAWAHTTGAGRDDMLAQIDNIRYTIDAARVAAAQEESNRTVPHDLQ